VNKRLAYNVLDDILNQKFLHNQQVWIGDKPVEDPTKDKACNTACCFAGRVALISRRKMLYAKHQEWVYNGDSSDGQYVDTDKYEPTDLFVPLKKDLAIEAKRLADSTDDDGYQWDHPRIFNVQNLYVVEDGELKSYSGPTICADFAARNDLGIDGDDAESLFEGDNTVEDLESHVENIFGPRDESVSA
jgi:hypothetical protein